MSLDKNFWRQRGTHLILLVGVALVATQLLDVMPRDQVLILTPPPNTKLLSVHATWLDTEGDELGGVRLSFPSGRPVPVRQPVQLANGDYEIHLEVELLDGGGEGGNARSKTNLRRRVTLRGGETPISLY